MEAPLFSIVTVIISVLSSSVFAALISQYFARKNLKTSQYIDVITSERIKWIDTVRSDVALLSSSVLVYMKNGDSIRNRDRFLDIDYIREMTSCTDEEAENMVINDNEFKRVLGNEIKILPSRTDIVKLSMFIKLKLNPIEDIEIIHILDNIIEEFSKINCMINPNIVECDSLIESCQLMFKREWDKVKEETKKR